MKKAITLIVFFLFSCSSSNIDCNTYYLIRHAEKVRLNPDDKDPELNEAGKERALVWKEYFNDLEIDKIFSTDYKRTMQTALPFSSSSGLTINTYSPSNIDYQDFMAKTKRDNVLIVGHSNTIPTFVNELIRENAYPDIEDSNNSNLYIVNKCGEQVNHQVIKIN